MEIISIIIILALLLSSCTTDERSEEIVIFRKRQDLDQWHNRQHLWMMHQKEKNKEILSENNQKRSVSRDQNVTHYRNEISTHKTLENSKLKPTFENFLEDDPMALEHDEAVLETY